MKKCTKCNLSFEDDKKFCRKCGTELETSSTNSPKELVKKEVYQDRLKTDPLNIELLHEYTLFLFDNSFFDETTTHSLKILEINKTDILAKELLFKSYLKLKLFNDASIILEQLLVESPNEIKYLEFQANILKELSNFDKAIESYDKILNLQPRNTLILNAKALTLIENNKIEEASAIFYNIFIENQDDKLTSVYVGIYFTLKGDYETAKNILTPILSEKELAISKIHKNRGLLYLYICLCNLNIELTEIKKWLSLIDFKVLSTKFPNIDERKLAQNTLHVINNELNSIDNSDNTKSKKEILIGFNFDTSRFYFTEDSNPILAEILYNIATKQADFKLYTESINFLRKAVEYCPNENKYKEKYDEIKKQLDITLGKSKKKVITIILSSLIGILIIVASIYLFNYFKEESEWKNVKKINTVTSFQNYLNVHLNSKYTNECKLLQEEAIWNEAKTTNTYDSYRKYILLYPSGKHINDKQYTKFKYIEDFIKMLKWDAKNIEQHNVLNIPQLNTIELAKYISVNGVNFVDYASKIDKKIMKAQIINELENRKGFCFGYLSDMSWYYSQPEKYKTAFDESKNGNKEKIYVMITGPQLETYYELIFEKIKEDYFLTDCSYFVTGD